MILQYLLRLNDKGTEKVERIEDGVLATTIKENEIVVTLEEKSGRKGTVTFLKNDSQIYSMWLLNDNFKTLKKLI